MTFLWAFFQVYPDKDINNIVESNHYTKVGGWCKLGRTKCRGPARWVKPFRCLGKSTIFLVCMK